MTWQPAKPGYEIPARLYSLLKSPRSLVTASLSWKNPLRLLPSMCFQCKYCSYFHRYNICDGCACNLQQGAKRGSPCQEQSDGKSRAMARAERSVPDCGFLKNGKSCYHGPLPWICTLLCSRGYCRITNILHSSAAAASST